MYSEFHGDWVNDRGHWGKTCFFSICFTGFIFKSITLKKLPMKLRWYIYILLGTDFWFLLLSLREKFVNFFSHLIFSALYPVFYGHIEKSISIEKSAFDWSFYWYLTIVSQMIYWFFEIFWSVKNQLLRNRLLKFFFCIYPCHALHNCPIEMKFSHMIVQTLLIDWRYW